MSYILDALRRADSERDRGAIPGIHAQPVPLHWRNTRGRPRMRPWVGAVIGLSVVVLGAFAWHLLGRDTPPDVAPAAAPPATPSTMSGSTPPVTAQQAPATVAAAPAGVAPPNAPAAAAAPNAPAPAAVAVAPATPAVPKAAERPRAPAPAPADPARRKPSPPTATAPATVTESTALRAAPKSEPAAAPPTTTTTSGSRVYSQNDLPQDIRRQLPALAIGGSMYSENPANRMLIINGQLVHEGATLAPELSLEQIKLRSAILKFKGYRYEISY